jgi:hypothetical protein
MGFFSNPMKAIKGFVRDPIGKIDNDINKMIHQPPPTKDQQKCQNQCFDLHVAQPPNLNFADKQYLNKEFQSVVGYSSCMKQCGKK